MYKSSFRAAARLSSAVCALALCATSAGSAATADPLSQGGAPGGTPGEWQAFGGIQGGCDGPVHAMALSADEQTIYVGGDFGICGNTAAVNVAAYDRASGTFSRLGMAGMGGTDNPVHALHVQGQDVYVAGGFSDAGTLTRVGGVARWDGETWHRVGEPDFGGFVYALAWHNGELVAGGEFESAGLVRVNHIARWNGSQWSAFEADGTVGTNHTVRALLGSDGRLYVGGSFSSAGGVTVNGVAAWDASGWSSLGGGVTSLEGWTGRVEALAGHEGSIVALGDFSRAGGSAAANVAAWNGSSWSPLSDGLAPSWTGALASLHGNLYAAGSFALTGTGAAAGIARWDGIGWQPLGEGLRGGEGPFGAALVTADDELYVGGGFHRAGDVEAANVAVLRSDDWSRWQAEVSGGIYAPATRPGGPEPLLTEWFKGSFYVGGRFRLAGDVPAENIARWDGTSWQPLGEGLDGVVTAMTVWKDQLVVAGEFEYSGLVPVQGLAIWTGSAWQAFPGDTTLAGNEPAIYALADLGPQLVVGGRFTSIGGASADSVAVWDGSTWTALGSGLSGNGGGVHALLVHDGKLYAGGTFDATAGAPATGIARWDDTEWRALGAGLVGWVTALGELDGALIVGGTISSAGGAWVEGVARWDGAAWSSIGTGTPPGVNGIVSAMHVHDDDLYVAGSFASAGGTSAHNIVRWGRHPADPAGDRSWHPLASDDGGLVRDAVQGLSVGAGTVFAVGRFVGIREPYPWRVSAGVAAFRLDRLFDDGFGD
jgi:hypothetical protein